MVPENITREHILQAATHIDKHGYPDIRRPTTYYVIVNGKHYPPKYIISKANEFANGEELHPYRFSYSQALRCLERLGFRIEPMRENP